MSGRIQERDLAPVHIYSIRTDVLCDTSGLLFDDMGLADGIQERCLAVVYMAHDADDGRPLLHGSLILLVLLQKLLDDVYLHLTLAEDIVLHGDILRVLVGNLLVHRNDSALQEQLLHDCGGLYLHLLRKFLDGYALRQDNHLDGFLCRFLFLLLGPDESAGLVPYCLVLFIDMVLLGALALLLAVGAPLFFLALLLHILARSFSSKALRFIISESSSLSRTASSVARATVKATVAPRTSARTAAIAHATASTRPAASLKAVLPVSLWSAILAAASS